LGFVDNVNYYPYDKGKDRGHNECREEILKALDNLN